MHIPLSVNTAYMFHFMHSLYSSIKCILKTNFSYVLCRWMIDQMMLVLDGGSGLVRIPGRGTAATSRPRRSRDSRGRGRDRPPSSGGRFELSSRVMTVPPPRQPPPTTP